MRNKSKLLMSVLVMTFLMTSLMAVVVSAESNPSGSSGGSGGGTSFGTPNTSGKQTFEMGYDCYHQPGIYPWECKQVEHKRDWFIKKDFNIWTGWCYWIDGEIVCHYTWYRPAKI